MKARSSHGGNIYAAARETGRSFNHLIDFSASINPLGPSPRAVQAMRRAIPQAVHYPDPDCLTLRERVANRLNLPLDALAMGNGSSELIHVLPPALSIRHAVIVGPTFSEYARALTAANGTITVVNAERAAQYRPPVERVLSLVQTNRRGIDAVFLCNPNSPTGQAVDVQALTELVTLASHRRIWLVVDETFVEYCADLSVVSLVGQGSRLVVLRSFTKFYGLPGLRIGYAAGPKDIIRNIRQRQPPWSVNALAQAAAQASLEDRPYARKSLTLMNAERRRFRARLKSIPGMIVFPSVANFLLVELPGPMTAMRCTALLHRQGLLIRDCSRVPGLNAQTIRVAVRTPPQNRRLHLALSRLLEDVA